MRALLVAGSTGDGVGSSVAMAAALSEAGVHVETTNEFARAADGPRPDAVLYFTPERLRSGLESVEREERRATVSILKVAVITSLATVPSTWVDPRIALYCTATDEAACALRDRGIDARRIEVHGLPVDARLGQVRAEPREIRARLRLMPTATTAVVLMRTAPRRETERLVRALARALPALQLCVVGAQTTGLFEALDGTGLPPTVALFKTERDLAELLRAADFVFCDPGARSIQEVLAAGRPAILAGRLSSRQAGNGAYVVRRGAGFIATTLADSLAAARRLSSEPALAHRAGLAAARLARPDAARRIAARLIALVEDTGSKQLWCRSSI